MQANSGDPDQTPHSVASDLDLHYLPMSHKKDARHIWVKMQLFCLSHKSCRNYGKYIVEIIFLGTSDLSKFINMKIKERQCHITKQLVHSFSVNIGISQPSKVMFTSASPRWTSLFSGWQILMLTSKECINCIMSSAIFATVYFRRKL